MESFYDVQQLLKKFGIFVYTKDLQADVDLMEFELNELHSSGLLSTDDYIKAKLIIRNRVSKGI
ncbi:YqgQ family protein [Chryseomicrobium palamuruense]